MFQQSQVAQMESRTGFWQHEILGNLANFTCRSSSVSMAECMTDTEGCIEACRSFIVVLHIHGQKQLVSVLQEHPLPLSSNIICSEI